MLNAYCFITLVALVPIHSVEPTEGILAEGTPFETPWVQIDGKAEGPTVFLVAGLHGDEAAGYVAAEAISHWSIGKGRLVVVPRANVPSIAEDSRRIPGLTGTEANLNRHFPSDAPPREGIASELWALVEMQQPDWLLDLHEGFGVKRVNKNSVGRSVIPCADPVVRALATELVVLADSTVEDPEHTFTLLGNPIRGSLARAAWERLGVRSMIIATSKKGGSVPSRARRHRLLVHTVLTHLEMEPCPPDILIDRDRAAGRTFVALYDGPGADATNVGAMRTALLDGGELVVRNVDGEDLRAGCLAGFDLVVHPAGSGSGQGGALGPGGREAVREFVRAGGAFLGVGAGAYLSSTSYSWSLGVVDARVIDRPHWKRGSAYLPVESTPQGRAWLGVPEEEFDLRYENGPILAPAGRPEIPDYTPLLIFRGEVTENGAPSGVMPGTPAAVAGTFGEGRAMAISPHPERTPGRGELLRRGVRWLVARDETEKAPSRK